MNRIVVCVSVSHGNTARVADAIAGELDAEVLEPEAVDPARLARAELVGFGSGIFGMAFHPRLQRFVADLAPVEPGTPAFVYCTSGAPELPFWRYRRRMAELLASKGFDVVGTFACRGFDTWLPLRLIGGLNRGRPAEADLAAARAFAGDLRARLGTRPTGRARSSGSGTPRARRATPG